MGPHYNETDFVPPYKPWEQRLCLVPDQDLFTAMKAGRADVVTGHIAKFEKGGVRLTDGTFLPADIVVTATGLKLAVAGKIDMFPVTHGRGSDPQHDGWLKAFSNTEGSNATSRGAYVTWEWYKGRYGTSVRLGGLDESNNAALQRYIVMHRADYAEPDHLERYGRLGRSNGCFAMGEEQFRIALMHLSGGRLLFADSLGLEEDGSIQPLPELAMIERPPLDLYPRPSISAY